MHIHRPSVDRCQCRRVDKVGGGERTQRSVSHIDGAVALVGDCRRIVVSEADTIDSGRPVHLTREDNLLRVGVVVEVVKRQIVGGGSSTITHDRHTAAERAGSLEGNAVPRTIAVGSARGTHLGSVAGEGLQAGDEEVVVSIGSAYNGRIGHIVVHLNFKLFGDIVAHTMLDRPAQECRRGTNAADIDMRHRRAVGQHIHHHIVEIGVVSAVLHEGDMARAVVAAQRHAEAFPCGNSLRHHCRDRMEGVDISRIGHNTDSNAAVRSRGLQKLEVHNQVAEAVLK